MTILNRKSRMISFRLSNEEYERATKCCAEQGHRSVSALARSATLHALPDGNSWSSVSPGAIVEMRDEIYRIRAERDRINGLIPQLQASSAS